MNEQNYKEVSTIGRWGRMHGRYLEENHTDYALEQVYNIIDSRYRSKRPLIITTNLTLDEIRHPQDVAHARIYDRVLEMCVPGSCFGTSIRKNTAQEKLNNLKSLIG